MEIKWVTISVNDLEKSKEFYRDYLGMKSSKEFSPNETMVIIFFESDNGLKIELIYNKLESTQIIENKGISIGIESPNYSNLLEEARAKNIIIAEPMIMGGNMECFFIIDPNGIGIQIIKPE